MTDVNEKQDIEGKLEILPGIIEQQDDKVITARETYHKAELEYECKYSKIVLSMKAVSKGDITQTDLKAEATLGSREERLTVILAESAYEREKKILNLYRDELDTAKERSYNYRTELKKIGG